jgi:hypothetical protein
MMIESMLVEQCNGKRFERIEGKSTYIDKQRISPSKQPCQSSPLSTQYDSSNPPPQQREPSRPENYMLACCDIRPEP